MAGKRLGKNAKQKQHGVHVQVLCGMKDVMVKKNCISHILRKPNFREKNFQETNFREKTAGKPILDQFDLIVNHPL